MTLVDAGQALRLQRETQQLQLALGEARRALTSAVAEQDRLAARVADLAEMLAAVETERDLAHRTLRAITAASGPPLSAG